MRFRGFTLLELLIVMIIIAVLAAIAIPNLSGSTKEAVASSVLSDLRNAKAALETYYASYKRYPTQTATAADGTQDNVVDGTVDNNGDGKPDGVKEYLADPAGNDSQISIVASPGNKVRFNSTACANGAQGYVIDVINTTYTDVCYTFNSCTDASPQKPATCPTF